MYLVHETDKMSQNKIFCASVCRCAHLVSKTSESVTKPSNTLQNLGIRQGGGWPCDALMQRDADVRCWLHDPHQLHCEMGRCGEEGKTLLRAICSK